ncbi:MAG: DNA primase [Candidatus Dormibacteria bacterium]
MSRDSPVEEIRSRVNLVDVVGQYVKLTRAGREWRGLCPFHTEHTPSFYVNPGKQLWNCHGCNKGGDLFAFIEEIEHTDFRGALEELAPRAGVELQPEREARPAEAARRRRLEAILQLNQLASRFYHHVLKETAAGQAGRRFLEARGVTAQDIEDFQLGYAPEGQSSQDNLVRFLLRRGGAAEQIQASGLGRSSRGGLGDFFHHRVVVPIRDERGRPVGFGGRALGNDGPKYLNTRSTPAFDKSRVLFGLDLAREPISRQRRAVLVEGYFDVIGAHRAGVATAVAASGTALTEEQVRLLHRFAEELILCFDADAAGSRAARAAVGLVSSAGMSCRLLSLPEGQDPDDLARSDPASLQRLVDEAPPAWEVLVDQALGEAGPGAGGAAQQALRRVMPVLGRIPESSIRELYAERVGRRLGISAERILSDVEGRGGKARTSGPGPGLAEPPAGQSALGTSAHLLGMLQRRPALLKEARDRFQLRRDDFGDPLHGRLFAAMVETDPEPLHAERLEPELGELLRQLPADDFPELAADPSGLRAQRALGDYVRKMRIELEEGRIADLRRRLTGPAHHRQGDNPQLVQEMERAQRRVDRLRRGEET